MGLFDGKPEKTMNDDIRDGRHVLYNTTIAAFDGVNLYVQTGGWNTVTTMKRLSWYGASNNAKGLTLDNRPWSGDWAMFPGFIHRRDSDDPPEPWVYKTPPSHLQ